MLEGFKTADRAFSKAAEKHRDAYRFGQVSDAEVIEAAGVKFPATVVYKKFDEGKAEYPSSSLSTVTLEGISEWLKYVDTPLMDEVSGSNYLDGKLQPPLLSFQSW